MFKSAAAVLRWMADRLDPPPKTTSMAPRVVSIHTGNGNTIWPDAYTWTQTYG